MSADSDEMELTHLLSPFYQHENVIIHESLDPLHSAIKNGNIEALEVLLNDTSIDLNSLSERNGYTALMMAIEEMKHLTRDQTTIYENMIKLLLKAGCNANIPDKRGVSPIYSAAEQGLIEIVAFIITSSKYPINIEPVRDNETLLHVTVKGMRSDIKNPKADFNSCLDLFLRFRNDSHLLFMTKTRINVNHLDSSRNTALHYATKNGDSETVLKLLRHGASISLRNRNDELPLADIDPKTLEIYLDECITTNSVRPNEEEYEMHIKYGLLVYPNNSHEYDPYKEQCTWTEEEDDSDDNVGVCDAIFVPETDAILYMTQNKELRYLLEHPVITSFLQLKWQCIRRLCFINLTLYSLLWICLILFIILDNDVTYVGVIIAFIFLIIRESFHLILSPVRYMKGPENFVGISLIYMTVWIVFVEIEQESSERAISAMAILFSTFVLVLLCGQFSVLSTHILMLKTALLTFFKFFLSYCILIIAFALSFYTLFRQVEEDDDDAPPQDLNNTENEKKEEFFNDPFRAMIKAIVMMTGEFDASSIPFSMVPMSYIIFIMFVFMITIVLSNLLNGLAVENAQEIMAYAKLVGHIYRVVLICYFESIFIGNASKEPIKCWSCLTHLQKMNTCINNFRKTFQNHTAPDICLFPHYLPKYKIIVKPNQNNKVWIPTKRRRVENDVVKYGARSNRRKYFNLDDKIVQNAKLVISKKKYVTEFDKIKATLLKLETKMNSIPEMKATLLKTETTLNTVLQMLEKMSVSSRMLAPGRARAVTL